MELRQLQYFVAVAEEQHFTRASQRVHIVQSALSSSIRALEEELGVQLFIRTTRRVQLTAAGELFLVKVRAALDAVQDARESVAALKGLKRGSLSIGTVQSLAAFLDLPSLLAAFYAEHPEIEVRLCQGSATSLIEKVQSGRLDLAVLPLCNPPDDVATELIACETMVLACAPDHRLAGTDGLSLSALRNESFVDFEPAWGTRKLVDHAFAEAGLERRIAFEVSDLDTLLELAARGLGVALIPEAIAARNQRLAIVQLAEPEICWELVVAFAAIDGNRCRPADHAPRAFFDLLMAQRPLDGANEQAAADLPQPAETIAR